MKVTTPGEVAPAQEQGKSVDLEQSVNENSVEDAVNTYNRVCARLLNPPVWHQVAGSLSGEFELVNAAGEKLERLAEVNDYIRISIPGPSNNAGDGFDWVKIERLEENTLEQAENSLILQLRSSPNPLQLEKGTAHFFSSTATSTFVAERTGEIVRLSYHGRNEVPNTDGEMIDKIRNTVVASGAALGLSELHWTALLKGLPEKELGG